MPLNVFIWQDNGPNRVVLRTSESGGLELFDIDSGTAVETTILIAQTIATDVGAGIEAESPLAALVMSTELATGAEAAHLTTLREVAEAAVGTESITTSVLLTAVDLASGTETEGVGFFFTSSDSAVGEESVTGFVVVVAASDFGNANEIEVVLFPPPVEPELPDPVKPTPTGELVWDSGTALAPVGQMMTLRRDGTILVGTAMLVEQTSPTMSAEAMEMDEDSANVDGKSMNPTDSALTPSGR